MSDMVVTEKMELTLDLILEELRRLNAGLAGLVEKRAAVMVADRDAKFDLTLRTRNALKGICGKWGIQATPSGVASLSPCQISSVKTVGSVTLEELRQWVQRHGFADLAPPREGDL